MSLLGKRGSKKGLHHEEIHTRRKYVDHSLNFLNWVNDLGFERSALGRFAYFLDSRFRLRIWLLLFFFSLGVSFFIFHEFEMIDEYSIGEIATTDIKSPVNITIIDEVATEESRQKAERGLPLVLDFEDNVYDSVYGKVYKAFRTMRNLVRAEVWPKSEYGREEKVKDFLKNKPLFEEELGIKVPDLLFEWLVVSQFSARDENIIIRTISRWSDMKIVDISEQLLQDPERQVIVRNITGGTKTEKSLKMANLHSIRDLAPFSLTGDRQFYRLGRRDQELLTKFAQLLLVANTSLNKQEFAERQKKVRDNVPPVQVSFKKNQTIVSAGNPVQPLHLTVLDEIRNVRSEQRKDYLSMISALLFVVLAIIFFTYLRKTTRLFLNIEMKDILVMCLVITIIMVITRSFLFVTDTIFVEKFGDFIPPLAYICAAPIAAGPMLIGLLLGPVQVVWIFTFLLSVIMAVMAELNFGVFIVCISSGITAAQGVVGCKKRNDIYQAGLKTGLMAALVASLFFTLESFGQMSLLKGILWCACAGLTGGLLSSFVSMALVPLLESLFNYTTDIKLLELSSLNHPLMQEMMMKAPGTYHHAMNVGNMVDAAANEIGANPLLGKVMAYYHDIGKVAHAQYFIENQRRGSNPHDQISPHMSKTILVAHVKDGAEIAINHKLGRPIVDGILQHHGTTLISFFFNKAIQQQGEEDSSPVDESDFRYPGPKPQFKEAALVMLADSIEATARSLEEPTPGRLNSIVENIVESKFMDGQLNECNLSIQDLATIKETFKRMLLSMYHQRMDYPHMRDGKVIAVSSKKKA